MVCNFINVRRANNEIDGLVLILYTATMGLVHLWCIFIAVLFSYNLVEQTYHLQGGFKAIDGRSKSQTMQHLDDRVVVDVIKPVYSKSVPKSAIRSAEYSTAGEMKKFLFHFGGQIRSQFDLAWAHIKNVAEKNDQVVQLKQLVNECVKFHKNTQKTIRDLLSDVVERVKLYFQFVRAKIMDIYTGYIQDYVEVILLVMRYGDESEKLKHRGQHTAASHRIVKGRYYEYVETIERMNQLEEKLMEQAGKLWIACRNVLMFYLIPTVCLVTGLVAGLYHTMPDTMASQAELVRTVALRVHGYFTQKRRKDVLSKKVRNRLRKRLRKCHN